MIKKSRMPSATAGSSWLIIFRLAMEKQNFTKKMKKNQFSVGVLQNSCTHISLIIHLADSLRILSSSFEPA